MPNALGIDIGGTSVKAALWADGRCVHTGQSPSYARPTAHQLHEAIRSAAGEFRDVSAVGLCVPGLLDRERRSITLAVNVPGLVGLRLDRLVPHALGLNGSRATHISNDAAATAHDIYASERVGGRLLALTLGTGVGIAVLDDGVPLRVEGDSPGHVGQFDVAVPGHDVVGPDGGAGGLEGYIGAAALRRQHGADFPSAIDRYTGDEPAILALVKALRICHAIYRPNHIRLCGGLGVRIRHLLPIIRQKVADRLTSLARADWTLDCGTDDFQAARGVAQLAARSFAASTARPVVSVTIPAATAHAPRKV